GSSGGGRVQVCGLPGRTPVQGAIPGGEVIGLFFRARPRNSWFNHPLPLSAPVFGDLPMEELIKQVSERAGINPEQARKAVETVVGYVKEHGPDVLAKLQGLVGQQGGVVGDVMGKLGGLFGKKE